MGQRAGEHRRRNGIAEMLGKMHYRKYADEYIFCSNTACSLKISVMFFIEMVKERKAGKKSKIKGKKKNTVPCWAKKFHIFTIKSITQYSSKNYQE